MRRWGRVALCAALFGLGVSAALVLTAVDVGEERSVAEVRAELDALRDDLGDAPPRWTLDARGVPARRDDVAPPTDTTDAEWLHIAAHSDGGERLVEIEAPMWFVALKGPALDLVLTHAGLDDLTLTASDLVAEPPGLLLDEALGERGRLLVWLE